ncbi:MAG TPA: 3'(2'),5'-bisphosphate nucleotidase CysQ [Terriglobia bacterium]|nr:3'(2'),5'-bisphosphate nucleotidase CysQ [Terriglobia bacterium]
MNDELDAAKAIAVQAGNLLLKYFAEKTSVRWKGKNNPVTDADQSASRFIVGELRGRFPLDGILSEEEKDDTNRLAKPRVWIIDPMDGTSEFIAGRSEFAVMIGLAVDGRPYPGVVYQPLEKKLFYAESGIGAFLETGSTKKQLRVSLESNPALATLAASRSHDSEVFSELADRPREFRESAPQNNRRNGRHTTGVRDVVMDCAVRRTPCTAVHSWDGSSPQR